MSDDNLGWLITGGLVLVLFLGIFAGISDESARNREEAIKNDAGCYDGETGDFEFKCGCKE